MTCTAKADSQKPTNKMVAQPAPIADGGGEEQQLGPVETLLTQAKQEETIIQEMRKAGLDGDKDRVFALAQKLVRYDL